MPSRPPSAPSHLSIFVSNPNTGRPVARLPLYAEVAQQETLPANALLDGDRQY